MSLHYDLNIIAHYSDHFINLQEEAEGKNSIIRNKPYASPVLAAILTRLLSCCAQDLNALTNL